MAAKHFEILKYDNVLYQLPFFWHLREAAASTCLATIFGRIGSGLP